MAPGPEPTRPSPHAQIRRTRNMHEDWRTATDASRSASMSADRRIPFRARPPTAGTATWPGTWTTCGVLQPTTDSIVGDLLPQIVKASRSVAGSLHPPSCDRNLPSF